jgi:hypothetical protein
VSLGIIDRNHIIFIFYLPQKEADTLATTDFEEKTERFNEIVKDWNQGDGIIALLTHEFGGHKFALRYFPDNTPIDDEHIEIGGIMEGWSINYRTKTLTLISGALCHEAFLNPLTFNLVSGIWMMQYRLPSGGSGSTSNLHLTLY